MTAYNQRVVNFSFIPQENKSYSDTGTVSGDVLLADLSLDITGESIVSNYDVKDNIGLTWDMISFFLFSKYDKILEIWQENKHITDTQKKSFSAPVDTPLFIPKLSEAEKNEIRNNTTNILPPWKR